MADNNRTTKRREPRAERGESIMAFQGRTFTVTLQSMAGSTGYTWSLASMPKEVVLISKCTELLSKPGAIAPVNEVFTFAAIDQAKSSEIMQIEFRLMRPWDPENPAETINIQLYITPYDEDNLKGFVKYSENSAVYSPNAVPGDLNLLMDYGFPLFKYGYYCANGDSSIVKYGYYCNTEDDCPVKYGYPPTEKYGYYCNTEDDCPVKYGYPPTEKYGYYCKTEDDCPVKYGYPPTEKYGYYCKTEDDCPVKYGYPPTKKYGYYCR